MESLRPTNSSKLEYFQLSREFHAHGLIYGKYRNLLWYRERYEEIKKFGTFDESSIKIKSAGGG